MSKQKTLVVAIYSHPEYYPPTLNALEQLAGVYDNIYIVHRNITGFDWQYPSNVQLVAPGKLFPVREVEKAGMLKKIGWFLIFTWRFFSLVRKTRPDTILLYDPLPVLSYRLIAGLIKKPRLLWYHNHDVAEAIYLRRYSLSWLAWKSEKWIFPHLQLFTLPAVERKQCFHLELLRGQFFFLPNFPSAERYGRYARTGEDDPVKLLYQGSIGPLHGLEEIIALLPERIEGRSLQLVLKGFISQEYQQQLERLAEEKGVLGQLKYLPPSGYGEVIENAFNCRIGIGIHKKNDMMNQTLGTASNKIYEDAAAGLPVLLYDNPHFRETLGKYTWVRFTNTDDASLKQAIAELLKEYTSLSAAAKADVYSSLSFENSFAPVLSFISTRQQATSTQISF